MREFSTNLFILFHSSLIFKEVIKAVISFIVAATIVKIFVYFTTKKWKAYAEKTKNIIDDLIVFVIQKSALFFYFLSIYAGLYQIKFSVRAEKIVAVSIKVLVSIYIVYILVVIVDWFIEYSLNREESKLKIRSFKGAMLILKLVIYSFGIVLILNNLGIDVTALITGLGITGIAVALAAQKILGDLFNYFTIVLDRPFEEGDFIVFGNFAGTVEHIGLKSTRVRSLSGEEIVVSNTNLIDEKIQNFKRMQSRRVVFKIGVVYETPLEKLKKIPEIIKNIIQSIDGVTFDRCHFVNFGDFSLDFETVYYVNDSDYLHYMNVHQEINLKMADEFAKQGISFAYPTQVIYLNNSSESQTDEK
jgi:small-conductance mechanosensitive channel